MWMVLFVKDLSGIRVPDRTYDPELEDVGSILTDICRELEYGLEFVVSGFGQDRWPVDVSVDLAIILEQFPEIFCAIREGTQLNIDFYEQGVERYIKLTPDKEYYVAECTSISKWQPNPNVERIHRSNLEKMLLDIKETFISVLEKVAPNLLRHIWIQKWMG
ncbi:MAG: hypothetical protein LBP86_04875 [Azoarcus sp.]|jgi:hypothetical protein|nr:hypothetical protein [Azoarcus sp.]